LGGGDGPAEVTGTLVKMRQQKATVNSAGKSDRGGDQDSQSHAERALA
jgi:hypothetical protein